jgi:hypothetical protein
MNLKTGREREREESGGGKGRREGEREKRTFQLWTLRKKPQRIHTTTICSTQIHFVKSPSLFQGTEFALENII